MDAIIQEMKGITIAAWAEVNAKLQTARRNTGIYEVSAGDKDYLVAEAVLKLENNKAFAMR